jgi:hypothetical protein
MGNIKSPKLAALQVLLRAFGVSGRSARSAARQPVSRPAVEVVSDFGVAPTFPGMR